MKKFLLGLLFMAWCSSPTAATTSINGVSAPHEDPYNTLVTNLLQYAKRFKGTPYRSGGTKPSGFDCSGFVRFVFAKYQMNIPHSSRELSKMGVPVTKAEARAGDLIFFGYHKSVNHVGIITSVSNGQVKFIHSATHKGVTISSTAEDYYHRHFITIRRVLNELKETEK